MVGGLLCREILGKANLIQSYIMITRRAEAQLTWDPAVRNPTAISWSLVFTVGRPGPA